MENENDNLKELEVEKLKCEISKIKTEEEEIRKRISEGVWNRKTIIQTVVGGIVAAALISAWLVGYFQPIIGKKQELLELQNGINEAKNQREKDLLIIEKENLQKSKKELEFKSKKLSEAFDKLSKDMKFTEKEKQIFAEEALKLKKETDELKTTLESSDELVIYWLIKNEWTLRLLQTSYKCSFKKDGQLAYGNKSGKANWSFENDTLRIWNDTLKLAAKIKEVHQYFITGTGNVNKKFEGFSIWAKLDLIKPLQLPKIKEYHKTK
jgi:hypothetical protein